MKVINKEIDMIAWFQPDGNIRPLKFKVLEQSEVIVKVDRVITREVQKIAGKEIHTFRCQSIINGMEKIYEIRYDCKELKWILFKI